MFNLGDIEKNNFNVICSNCKRTRQRNNANVRKLCKRSGEICLLNLIGEGKIRHIFNLGITTFNEIQKEPRKVLSKNYFSESVYVEHLLNVIKHLENENEELRIQLNDNHIPYID